MGVNVCARTHEGRACVRASVCVHVSVCVCACVHERMFACVCAAPTTRAHVCALRVSVRVNVCMSVRVRVRLPEDQAAPGGLRQDVRGRISSMQPRHNDAAPRHARRQTQP